jgi:hypothetical protein
MSLLSCHKCNKMCKSKAGLTLHIKSCFKDEEKICKHCDKEFSSLYNLRRHQEDKSCPYYITIIEKQIEELKLELANAIVSKKESNIEANRLDRLYNEALNKNETLEKINQKLEKDLDEQKNTNRMVLEMSKKIGNTNNYVQNNNRITNNQINLNSLPALDNKTLNNVIKESIPSRISTNPIYDYGKKLSNNFKKYAFLNDAARGTIVWNDGNKIQKDPNGKMISKKICSNKETVKFLNSITEEQKRLESLNDLESSNTIAFNKVKWLKDKESTMSDMLRQSLPSKEQYFKEPDYVMSNYDNALNKQIAENPAGFLFGAAEDLAEFVKTITFKNGRVFEGDDTEDHTLTAEKIHQFLKKAYNSFGTLTTSLSEIEAKAMIESGIDHDHVENYNHNIMWFNNQMSKEEISTFAEEILSHVL